MNNNPTEPNFDWVTARVECSLHKEFERLRQLVKANCQTAQESLPTGCGIQFSFHDIGTDEFSVVREPVDGVQGTAYTTRITRTNNDILVVDGWSNPAPPLALTLTLSDDGECRFVIDGEGKYLRWQVARKALYGLFFDGPRAP